MVIGFITPEYPHEKVTYAAGIATSIKNLAIGLVKNQIKVIVFVYHQNESTIFFDEGVEVHLISKKVYMGFTWYFYRKHIQNYINSIISKENINLIEAPDWTGITAFMKFKVPLVIRFHGSDAYFCKLENRKQKLKNYIFEKMALKNANAYIAPTNYAGIVTQEIFGLEKEKIVTIHYGLELQKFDNINPETYNKNTILYVGTIIRKKGVFELVKIFNKVLESVPDAQLILIGIDSKDIKTNSDSTYELIFSKLSPLAQKQTSYLGKVSYMKVQKHIKSANICVFPSFAETLGMVTIESMALKKPVVNTNIGWAKELIDDGVNGFLVHPENTSLFTEKIITVLKNRDLAMSLGQHAREKVEQNFNIDKQVKKNISYFKSLV